MVIENLRIFKALSDRKYEIYSFYREAFFQIAEEPHGLPVAITSAKRPVGIGKL